MISGKHDLLSFFVAKRNLPVTTRLSVKYPMKETLIKRWKRELLADKT